MTLLSQQLGLPVVETILTWSSGKRQGKLINFVFDYCLANMLFRFDFIVSLYGLLNIISLSLGS